MPPKTIAEGIWRRHGNTTSPHVAIATAPTTVAHGIDLKEGERGDLVSLDIIHSATGAHSFSVEIYGYKPRVHYETAAGAVAPITSSAGWTNIGTISVSASVGTAASECHQLQGATRFSRLAARLTGTAGSPTVYLDFGFIPATRGG